MEQADFLCQGNILMLLLGDQFHDFLGDRVKGKKGTELENIRSNMKDIFQIAWGFLELDEPNKTYVNQAIDKIITESHQKLAEETIKKFSMPGYGDINGFKFITEKGKLERKYEMDLGRDTRRYIQIISKLQGVNIQVGGIADVKIDALGSNKNFLTAMLNFPVSSSALPKQCEQAARQEGLYNQIMYTPILPNIYDEAAMDDIYYSSAAYNGIPININRTSEAYRITDANKNTVEWSMLQVPKFYEIAIWYFTSYKREFILQFPKFTEQFPESQKNVNEFIKKLQTHGYKDDKIWYHLYVIMCKSCDKFLNHKITLTDGNTFNIGKRLAEKVLKGLPRQVNIHGKTNRSKPNLENSFAPTYTATEAKFLKEGIKYLEDVSSRILRLFEPVLIGNSISLYYLGNCKDVKLDKQFMEQFVFKSFGLIDSLTINTKIFGKESLMDYQLDKIGTNGLSVANIFSKISTSVAKIKVSAEGLKQEGEKILALLFLKTLGDLSLTTSCFYNGVAEMGALQKVNFLATFDRTSAAIATTLLRVTPQDNQPLYRNILLQVPGQGISAYLDKQTTEIFSHHEEVNVEGILEMSNMSIRHNEDIEKDKLATENCDYFKKYIQDNASEADVNDKLKDLDCYKKYEYNWMILENDYDTLQGKEVLESIQVQQELEKSWIDWLLGAWGM